VSALTASPSASRNIGAAEAALGAEMPDAIRAIDSLSCWRDAGDKLRNSARECDLKGGAC
jgi:hypothetical protein